LKHKLLGVGIPLKKNGIDKFRCGIDQMELSGIGIDKMELTPCLVPGLIYLPVIQFRR